MMNEMPKPQKFLIYLSWAFAGLMGLGGVISVINDTLYLVTLPVSLVGTGLIVVFYFGAQQYLKHYGWQTEHGRITRLNFGMILPLLGMIALLWLPQLVQLAPGSRAFPRAAADEALIVVATFHRTEGVVDSAVHDEIRRAIQRQIDALNLEKVRVAVEPAVIPSANREQAEALGKRYNAALIIWGSDSGVRLEINFLNLKEPDSAAAEVTISETLRTQLANPEAYSQFVVNELPRQLTYLSLFALARAETGQENYEGAIVLLETAVVSLPDLTNAGSLVLKLDTAYFRLGWLHQTTGQLQPAIAYYNEVIALNPENATAFYNRGLAHADLGNFEQVITEFDRAITLNPENAFAFTNRGLAHYYLGNYEEAIRDFDQAIALNPEEFRAFNNRGLVYAGLDDYEQAIVDYNQAISFNPKELAAFYNKGNAYYSLGNYEQAIANYNQAIALNPEFALAFNKRGTSYVKLGDYARAIADFNHTIALNPEDALAFNNRALAYVSLGDYERAIADFDQVIALNPMFATAYLTRALTFLELRQNARALLDLHTYLALDHQSPEQEAVQRLINQLEAKLEN